MTFLTPVVLIIFRRPDLTAAVFEAIRQAKPKQLLVIADGPRNQDETKKCLASRKVIEGVDWNCDVSLNYSDNNLGARQRVSSGLDWVFSQVEDAIILEDDCVPSQSFFRFCQEMLKRYRHDERVMHINGTNVQSGYIRTNSSYYFSKYAHVWGWASWQRAWNYYDVTMKTWPEYKEANLLTANCENEIEEFYWADRFQQAILNNIDAWDYQWLYTCWSQSGLAITPEKNLISNRGFRPDATHTRFITRWADQPTNEIEQIVHPKFMVRNKEADTYTFNVHFGGLDIAKHMQATRPNLVTKGKIQLARLYNTMATLAHKRVSSGS